MTKKQLQELTDEEYTALVCLNCKCSTKCLHKPKHIPAIKKQGDKAA